MNLTPVTTPPTDPSQVVIVVQNTDNVILASSFKYKKGKWVGQSSGVKYTTEELVLKHEAFWFVSPLQPDYNHQPEKQS